MTVTQSTHHMYLRRSPTHQLRIPISPQLLSIGLIVVCMLVVVLKCLLSLERTKKEEEKKKKIDDSTTSIILYTSYGEYNEQTCCSEEGQVGGVEKSRKYIQKITRVTRF